MDLKYYKREGTSGMCGQLYEINLVSLILSRLQSDEDINELYLASNMDKVGSFDDICFRINITGRERPLLVFIQAKHKENDDAFLNYDLVKHFHNSYIQVRQNFSSNKDVFFKGKFEEAEFVFVLYTNAKYFNDTNNVNTDPEASSSAAECKQARKPYQSSFSNKLNRLISTGDADSQGFHTHFTDKDLESVNETILEEEITALAEHFVKFLNDKSSMKMMLDNYIIQYHVILAKNVVNISDIRSNKQKCLQWREMTFQHNLFYSQDKIVTMLRKQIYEQILQNKNMKNNKNNVNQNDATASSCSSFCHLDDSTVDKLITLFLTEPSALTLCPLIETYIICRNGNLTFIIQRPNSDVKKLEEIELSPPAVEEAEELAAARKILLSLKLKVPVTFGNIDLTMGGSQQKIEARLNTLADFICGLCKQPQLRDKTVVIDETVGDGYLSVNNGIGGTVGNLLIYDVDTKCLKITDNDKSLPNNARALFDKLNTKIDNLHSYRFDVSSRMTFPKLIFDCIDKTKEILSKVVIYEKQSNHRGVEAILKNEIEQYQLAHNPHNVSVKSDTIVTEYQKIIQTWWLSPKGEYITKIVNTHEQAVQNILKEPQISAMQTAFYLNNVKYLSFSFNEAAMESFAPLKVNSQAIIVTDTCTLTTMKVIQCYRNNSRYVVLDLKFMLNLPSEDFSALLEELKNTKSLVVVVCDYTKTSRTLHRRLDDLGQATEEKQLIVITKTEFVEAMQEYFPTAQVFSEQNQGLIDFTLESQNITTKNAQVIFQGKEISLDLLVDDVTIGFIKSSVLNKIFGNETIIIGKSLSGSSYEEVKHLYIDRKVKNNHVVDETIPSCGDNQVDGNRIDNVHVVRTFLDINKDVVLITATPGMGKSTLLTHLSLTTKELDPILWIVRINLLDHSKVFYDWTVRKTTIDIVETLKFICKTILNNNQLQVTLKQTKGQVYLDGCTGDEWITFELNMFLHFYNERKILFLFDGFDEICPFYKDTVLQFLDMVKKYPRQHKMWVTSRPYSEILPDLETVLGKAYEIEYISDAEQDIYLTKFWQDKLPHELFNKEEVQSKIKYLKYLRMALIPNRVISKVENNELDNLSLLVICDHLMKYLASLLLESSCDRGLVETQSSFASSTNTHNLEQRQTNNLLGSPLLLHIISYYFLNLLDHPENISDTDNVIALANSQNTLYKGFIDIKLRKILFQDKNKMDVYKPDIRIKYEKEYTECYNIHKKLAAYVIFKDTLFNNDECCLPEFEDMRPFNEQDSTELEAMLDTIRSGRDKTGLILYVTVDSIPVFIHKTFAEYFATEYINDIIWGPKFDMITKKLLLFALLLINTNVFPWTNLATSDQISNISKNKIHFHHFVTTFNHRYWSTEQLIRLIASSPNGDYEETYSNIWKNIPLDLSNNDRDALISNIIKNLVSYMKPHLKKHFTSGGWPVDSTADYCIRHPVTPLRKQINRVFKLRNDTVSNLLDESETGLI